MEHSSINNLVHFFLETYINKINKFNKHHQNTKKLILDDDFFTLNSDRKLSVDISSCTSHSIEQIILLFYSLSLNLHLSIYHPLQKQTPSSNYEIHLLSFVL